MCIRDSDFYLMKVNESGEIITEQRWGTDNNETLESLEIVNDQLLLFGTVHHDNPDNSSDSDMVLIPIDANNPIFTSTESIEKIASKAIVFPNPADDITRVILSPAPVKEISWKLFDVSGKQVRQGSTRTGGFSIPLLDLNSGVYFLSFPRTGYRAERILVK